MQKFTLSAVFIILVFNVSAQKNLPFHLPAAKTEKEIRLGFERAKNQSQQLTKKGAGLQMPANMRMPGEFEESQSVHISWAYDYVQVNQDSFYVSGNDVSSSYGFVSAQLAHYIADECLVIIRAWSAADTTSIKNYMTSLGWSLKNYQFVIAQGDDWWTRDYGPMGFYYSNQDSIGFTDLKYYPGRDLDNDYPILAANLAGYPVFTTTLNAEGGNLMTDGFGTMIFSNRIEVTNASNSAHLPAWTYQQTYDTMRNVLGTPVLVDTTSLQCDGGTGHIDLYTKYIDEQTIMVAKYPDTIKAIDKTTIEKSYQQMLALNSTYKRPHRIYRIPHPTNDNGKHTRLSCTQINADARNFVNGLTVNKTFLYPSYSDDQSGNQQQTAEITQLFKNLMPGYKVIPIDSRDLSPLGGALHCITMQIPVENPVLFWHPSVDGLQNLTDNFNIVAKITNKSGIAAAKCMWRLKGTSTWNTLNLADSSGLFTGKIVSSGIQQNQRIEYYLTATTNNGKIAVKPITAPEGFYTLFFEGTAGQNEAELQTRNYLLTVYPNPATQNLNLGILAKENGVAAIRIFDMLGNTLYQTNFGVDAGLNEHNVAVSAFASGIYFCELLLDGKPAQSKKFVVNR